jgi:hypothetical protein
MSKGESTALRPADTHMSTTSKDKWASYLPSLDIQEHLLKVYFTYVHAQLLIVHKKSLMDVFWTGCVVVTLHLVLCLPLLITGLSGA